MDGLGMIHEQLDIKILILYVLARLPGPIDRAHLADIVFCDGGVDYFSFSECLADLVATGHIAEENDRFVITEQGQEDGSVIENSLPASVREKATLAIKSVEDRIERETLLQARHTFTEQGCTVELKLSDGEGDLLHLTALVGEESQALRIEKNFHERAEKLYVQIMELLTQE